MNTSKFCVLVAPDKFKGSLTAKNFCRIAKKEITEIFPYANVISLPLADGGEGSLECFTENTDAVIIQDLFTGPDFDKICAKYALSGETAFIEAAETAGLTLTKLSDPTKTTTYGIGEQILNAEKKGAKRIFIALGGSATNDAGCGMAAALGYTFFDKDNETFIPTGGTLARIERITFPHSKPNLTVTALCDVDNPLFGTDGASFVYARQKGATDEQIRLLDDGLRRFNDLTKTFGRDYENFAGAGAAGGLGAGVDFFLGGKLKSGFETLAELSDVDGKLNKANLIISGEGKLDEGSRFGKTVFPLWRKCRGKPFVVFCGVNEITFKEFEVVEINGRNESKEEAIKNTERNLAAAIRKYFLSLSERHLPWLK